MKNAKYYPWVLVFAAGNIKKSKKQPKALAKQVKTGVHRLDSLFDNH
jgi:hypothetical protein